MKIYVDQDADDNVVTKILITEDSRPITDIVFENIYEEPDKPSEDPGKPGDTVEKPEEPEDTEQKPEKPTDGSEGSDVDTGDHAAIGLWIALAGIALAAIIAVFFMRKKNRY